MPFAPLNLNNRQTVQAGEPVVFRYPDGRLVEFDTPSPGRVRITNGIGVVIELDADEFVKREREPLQ